MASRTSQNPVKVKAVVFDLGGVIIPSPVLAFQAFEAAANLPVGTVASLVMPKSSDTAWSKLETGRLTLHGFVEQFQTEIKAKIGKDVNMTLLLDQLSTLPRQPYPVIIDAIRCLREEGLKVALLTNNWFFGDQTRDTTLGVETLDLSLFDVVVESRHTSVRKPDPEIYRICQQRLGVVPEGIVFLDDLGQNLKAANQLGWKTIKVTDYDKAVSDLETLLDLQLRGHVPGTVSVPRHLRLDGGKLGRFFSATIGHSTDLPIVRNFEHGQSNPTYLVQYGGKKMVLRKKPPGKLLPSAHAVDREYRVMKAVGEHGVPVPDMLAFCDDDSVIGTPFYLMEYVDGRIFKVPAEMGVSPPDCHQMYTSMIDVLCKIHSVDISKAGLDDYGKKGNYIERNFRRWRSQYEASKTGEIPSLNRLIEWIPKHIPKEHKLTLVHGDFRIDNLIYSPHSPDVIGVLDWELSTLGDPITDLMACCFFHYVPRSSPFLPGLDGVDIKAKGIPTVQELIGRYCQQMKIPPIRNWDFYVAFTFFKMAAILQGVYKRSISGQGSSDRSQFARTFVEQYAEIGWRFAQASDLNSANTVRDTERSRLKTHSIMSYISRPMSVDRSQPGSVGEMAVSVEALSPRVQALYQKMRTFIRDNILPVEREIHEFSQGPDKWKVHPIVSQLKRKARADGLWNLFLPLESDEEQKYGAGLTNIEYAFFCEEMGKVPVSSSIFNCNAPDTGNMEVLVRYGTEEQKQKWLTPLLNGEIRSCFGMTEPAVASSDATNIQSSIRREGDYYVINGHKWWTSNAMHPDCKLCIFMGKTSTSGSRYRQQSMIIVPMDAPGVKIVRPLSVFGYEHAPSGHGEVVFENVRVPASNMLLGEGRGFEIAQGRLGPGRIHHCMRLVGVAERALELMIERTKTRVAFGKPLAAQGTIQADVARSRIEIEQTRLLVLKAAYMMDVYGNKVAAPEIAMIKVAAPSMTLRVIDRAIQAHGGAGVSDDFPLAAMFAQIRTLRLADGPDEVHQRSVARMEYAKSVKSAL